MRIHTYIFRLYSKKISSIVLASAIKYWCLILGAVLRICQYWLLQHQLWTFSIYISWRLLWIFEFGCFLFKQKRVWFIFLLNSDHEVSTSGLINFQGGILELVTGFMMSKGFRNIRICTLLKIYLFHWHVVMN